MGLARAVSQIATAIIRRIGDSGGALERDVTLEINNLIAWAKDAVRNINTDTSVVGNITTGLDALHSYSLPAGTLATDKDYLRVRYSFLFANNANTKRIKISFDSQSVHDPGLFDQRSGTATYDILYTRVSSTSVRASLMMIWNFGTRDGAGTAGGNYLFVGDDVTITVANLNSNSVTLLAQGEGTNTDDIRQNLSVIELRQQ
jgi:hypothetical protein